MTKRVRKSKLERRRSLVGYLFAAPFILGALLGVCYPVILSVIYSLGKLVPQTIGYKIDFVGLQNYKTLFTVDPTFVRELLDTLKTTLLNVPVVIIFSFFLACILNADFKGRGIARAILFMPMIVFSKVVMNLMSGDIVTKEMANKGGTESITMMSGALNDFLETMGAGEGIANLLSSSVNNITNILVMSVIPTIVILAGLQSISGSIYEASYVEGATAWEVLWKISLPIVSPLLLVSVIYCVIDSFTGYGNTVISRVRTECFTKYDFGLGSAIAWSYLLVVLLIVAVVFFIVNRFVSYDN